MADIKDFKTHFKDSEEELRYWKDQAHHYRKVVQEVQDEMAEFTEFSKDLERELESQLKENEKELKELRQRNMKLNLENETFREKLESQQEESYQQITNLEDELAMANALKAENLKYIRELEQANDDLERTKRATIVSLEDFEKRLNQAIERNAFLESELDEKEALAVTVQRLRDEARDLGQELAVQKRREHGSVTEEKENKVEPVTPSKPTTLPTLTRQPSTPASPSPTIARVNNISQPSTPTRDLNGSLTNGQLPKGTPLTPSARVSALNIVGELLRKVGALESKLSSCRSFVRETPTKGMTPTSNRIESPSWEKQTGRSNGAPGLSKKITTTMKMSV